MRDANLPPCFRTCLLASCHPAGSRMQSVFVSGLNNIHVRLQVTVFDYKCRDSPGGLILKDTTLPHSKGVAVVGFPKSNFSFTNVHFHNM